MPNASRAGAIKAWLHTMAVSDAVGILGYDCAMRRYLFADESGCFNFSRQGRASKYFIICTVTMDTCAIGEQLLGLRRKLAWEEAPIGHFFHATEDRQVIRDQVFDLISKSDLLIYATILEKAKAEPQTHPSKHRFYQYAWHYHLKWTAKRICRGAEELMVTTASVETKKAQRVFTEAVFDVVGQHVNGPRCKVNICQSSCDPCLQVADYCTWALSRKWEANDLRSYEKIKPFVRHEYDVFARGTKMYY